MNNPAAPVWAVGLDTPADKENKYGTHDSGRHVCPNCDELQDHTIFDGFVSYHEGADAGLYCHIPEAYLRQYLEDIVKDKDDAGYFNLGSAIMNAAQTQLIKRFGMDAAKMFPNDWEYIADIVGESND